MQVASFRGFAVAALGIAGLFVFLLLWKDADRPDSVQGKPDVLARDDVHPRGADEGSISIDPREPSPSAQRVATLPGTLSGTVHGWRPCRDRVVVLHGEDGTERRLELDADSFSVTGLRLGTFRVEARCGQEAASKPVEVRLTSEAPHATVALRLFGVSYPVVLHDGTGKPVRKVGGWRYRRSLSVVAGSSMGSEVVRGVFEDPDGVVTSSGGTYVPARGRVVDEGSGRLVTGYLRIKESPPLVASLVARDLVLDEVLITDATRVLTFVVDAERTTGSVSGRVVDAEGAPVQAGVVLVPDPRNEAYALEECGEDGRFELQNVAPGPWTLVTQEPGYAKALRDVRVSPGVDHDLGDLVLPAGARVTGRVFDPDGRPLGAEVWVGLVGSLTVPEGLGLYPSERFDENGYFGVFGLPRSTVLVGLRGGADWAWNPLVVDLRSGDADDLTLVARKGTAISVGLSHVLDLPMTVSVSDAAGLALWTERVLPGETNGLCVVPQDYTAVWTAPSGEEKRVTFPVGAKPLEIVFQDYDGRPRIVER